MNPWKVTPACAALAILLASGTTSAQTSGRFDRGALRERLLERFDADGDGALGLGERDAVREKLRAPRGAQHGDARDSIRERIRERVREEPRAERGDEVRERIHDKVREKVDGDADGKISRDERERARAKVHERLREHGRSPRSLGASPFDRGGAQPFRRALPFAGQSPRSFAPRPFGARPELRFEAPRRGLLPAPGARSLPRRQLAPLGRHGAGLGQRFRRPI